METLKYKISDDKQRSKHIIENMLYMVELNSTNFQVCKKICSICKPWLFIRNLLTRALILKDIRKYIWFDINCISPFAYK